MRIIVMMYQDQCILIQKIYILNQFHNNFFNFNNFFMGNEATTKTSKKHNQEEVSYINHPKFQKVPIVTINQNKYMQITISVHSQRQVKEWEKGEKSLQSIDKQNLLLKHSYEFQREGMCGSSGNIKILYENYPFLLIDQITNRKGLEKLFQQTELWYLLFTIISTAKDFEKLSYKVGDIRPENIFINEDGQVKLANAFSWPSEQSNYFKSLLNRQVTYLSPEELKQLENLKNQSSCDQATAQSFSIALTILDAGLLLNNTKLYNFTNSNWKFDVENFKEVIQQWKSSNYSDFLKKVVLDIAELDPKNRKKPSDIYKLLLPYQDDIKILRQFVVNTPQQKIIQNNTTSYQSQQQNAYLVRSQLMPEYGQYTVHTNQNFTTIQSPPVTQFQQIPTQFVQQQPAYINNNVNTTQTYQRIISPNPNIIQGGPFVQQPYTVQYQQSKIPGYPYYTDPNIQNFRGPQSQTIQSNFSRPYSIPYNPLYPNTIPTYYTNLPSTTSGPVIVGNLPSSNVSNKIEIKPNQFEMGERGQEQIASTNLSQGQNIKSQQM